jgi:hypothetical protein
MDSRSASLKVPLLACTISALALVMASLMLSRVLSSWDKDVLMVLRESAYCVFAAMAWRTLTAWAAASESSEGLTTRVPLDTSWAASW